MTQEKNKKRIKAFSFIGKIFYYIVMAGLILSALAAMIVPAAIFYITEWVKKHYKARTASTDLSA